MEKKKLFLDFDNTLVNYTKCFCEAYNELYPFKTKLDWTQVRKYNFSCVAPTMTDNEKWAVMAHPLLAKKLKENYFDDAVNIINEIAEETEVTIISLCGINTVDRKYCEVKRVLPKVGFIPIICGTNMKMDKSHINMEGGVFIDDRVDMLQNSNADIKICMNFMGYATEWCQGHDGVTFTRWKKDFEGKLLRRMLELP